MSAIERVAETNPIWWPTTQEESGPTAEGRYDVDLVVIGAGLAGLAAAHYVTEYRPELAVGVVEAKHVGAGATGRSTGRSDRAGRRAHGCGGRQGRLAHWSRQYRSGVSASHHQNRHPPAFRRTRRSREDFCRLLVGRGRFSSCPARVSRTVATKTNIYRGRRGDICVRALTLWQGRIR
jgi:monoamine oxidase